MGTKTDEVERAIREIIEIEQGPNGELPSERALAARLSAGRTTVRLVLMKLATEGIIRSEHGRGYFATTPRSGDPVNSSDDGRKSELDI
jgi:DNA-binding FadR family transcriptional regulator